MTRRAAAAILVLSTAFLAGCSHRGDPPAGRGAARAVDRPVERQFRFVYRVEVPAVAAGAGPVDLFVPLARTDRNQEILARTVRASIPGAERTEARYGNLFWHGHLEAGTGEPITVEVSYDVRRRLQRRDPFARGEPGVVPADGAVSATPAELEKFLLPNRRVPVSGELIDRIRADLPRTGDDPASRARAIYDYVVDNMEYKKVGAGWGNGDTYWACSEKYGNCTDFHALFISLARAEGIPARFEIGYPVPEDRPSGEIAGYHCWVEFHLPGVGWVPVDASEAWKNPAMRDFYFGTQPADRIQFTVGRDLELGPGHTTGPLNYFVDPHLEVAGRAVPDVKARVHYRTIPDGSSGVPRASADGSPADPARDGTLQ